MRYWMHGVGNDIPSSIRLLKNLGFEAVVGNDQVMIDEANAVGLDVYLCSGAFGAHGKFSDPKYLAQDINGKPQLWFNSTCPNDPEVRQHNLENIVLMTRTKGIKGILIDGARFASPASSTDPDAFYTCFCSTCEKKACDLGFNFKHMKKAVEALYQRINHDRSIDLSDYIKGLVDWLAFRRVCTTEHLINFSKTVKNQNPGLLTGIYIFSPSIAPLVGQNYHDLQKHMDIFSPMIYRHYKAKEGPACLNFELSVIAQELGKSLLPMDRAISLISSITGIEITEISSPDDILNGLSPKSIGNETQKAKAAISDNDQLVPIIQLDDERLAESIAEAEKAGADCINFFVYNDKLMEEKREVFENLFIK